MSRLDLPQPVERWRANRGGTKRRASAAPLRRASRPRGIPRRVHSDRGLLARLPRLFARNGRRGRRSRPCAREPCTSLAGALGPRGSTSWVGRFPSGGASPVRPSEPPRSWKLVSLHSPRSPRRHPDASRSPTRGRALASAAAGRRRSGAGRGRQAVPRRRQGRPDHAQEGRRASSGSRRYRGSPACRRPRRVTTRRRRSRGTGARAALPRRSAWRCRRWRTRTAARSAPPPRRR